MKPTLVIFPDGGQLFAAPWINGHMAGLWTAEAFQWILESYKPLIECEVMDGIFVGKESREAFEKTPTAQEVLAKLSA